MSEIKKTTLTPDEARAALAEYQDKTGKSQAQIAREMDYSPAAISRFKSGTYDAEDEFIKALTQYLKITAKRQSAPKRPPYKETSTSKQVAELIGLCHKRGEMGVAYGDPGVGKTMAVRHYAKENEDAIIITVSPTTATITGVNDLIANKLGTKEKTQRRITAAIVAQLKGAPRVIVIDEAQHLKAKVVNHLRSIVDATENEYTGERIGMALIGNDEIYLELKVKQAAAYSQVSDRITYWKHLVAREVKKEDIALIFTEAKLEDDALELLYRISTTISTRKAVQVFTNTLALFGVKDYSALTTAQLAAVVKDMKIRIL